MIDKNKIDYPNPIFIRENTVIINDGWLFSFDGVHWRDINVPFCPESKLSGIGYTDFIPQCYYKKSLEIKSTGKHTVLHFGAVDYRCNLYINGKYVGSHVGGYTPFEFDITDYIFDGKNELKLDVFDNEQRKAPSGKQSHKQKSFGCFYTRTTGIWQNVWLEFVPEKRIKQIRFYPNIDTPSVGAEIAVGGCGKLSVKVFYRDKKVGEYDGVIEYKDKIDIPLCEKHLWGLGKGELYDVEVKFEDDTVYGYFGLRSVGYGGYEFLLNGEPVYQKLVLDQGYYADGIYTAPSVAAMQKDIDIALDLGFNGARLHQKVFDPKFLYLCDKAGYMVWGEFASWGVDYSSLDFLGRFLNEWEAVLARDFDHPSIVTWCPLNEAWGTWEDSKEKRDVKFMESVYDFTKKYDNTRPCVDVSGGHHCAQTDLFDFHCYESVESLKKYLDELENNGKLDVPLLYCEGENLHYTDGLPVNISECGGICFTQSEVAATVDTVNEGAVDSEESWGYGKGEKDGDAFVKRYGELMNLLFCYTKLSGFCYTQLYDVEQEENGLYFYDRTDKLTGEQKQKIRDINDGRGRL